MRTVLLPSLLGLLAVACQASIHATGQSCGASTTGDSLVVTSPTGLPDAAGASPTTQSDPSAATNGTSYLVAWTDTVLAPNGRYHSVIAASLLDETGKIANDASFTLRPDGIPLDIDDEDSLPVVASNGDGFLVTWMHEDGTGASLEGVRLDKNGVLVDGTPFTIGALAPAQSLFGTVAPGRSLSGASTAWNGSHYLVTWSRKADDGTSLELDGMLIASDGTKSDALSLVQDVGGDGASTTTIATGSEFLVAWDEPSPSGGWMIRSASFDDVGTALHAAPTAVVAEGQLPALATNGDSIFLAWSDFVNDGVSLGVFTSPLDGSGAASAPRPVANGSGAASVVWNGTAYVVASATGYAWLSPTSEPSTQWGAALSDGRPALATTESTTFLFGAEPDANKNERLYGRLSDRTDEPITTVFPARSTAPQEEIATAWDGSHLAAVWTEARGADRDRRELWSAFFDASGKPTSAPARLRYDTDSPHAPTIVANGDSFVVAWTELQAGVSSIAWTSLSATSATVDPPRFVTGSHAALTAGGGHPLLFVDGLRGYFADGTVSDSAPALTLPFAGTLAWDGTYFVGGYLDGAVVRALRFDANGTPEPSALTIADLGKATPAALAMATDLHGTTLFGWVTTGVDGSTALSTTRFAKGAIDAEAKRIDVAAPGVPPSSPTLAFDGSAWLVGYSTGPALTCAHLEVDGATIDVRETITMTGSGRLALSGGTNRAFVAYQDVEAEALHALVPRVQLRVLEEPSVPAPPVTEPVLPAGPTADATSSSSSSSSSGGCR